MWRHLLEMAWIGSRDRSEEHHRTRERYLESRDEGTWEKDGGRDAVMRSLTMEMPGLRIAGEGNLGKCLLARAAGEAFAAGDDADDGSACDVGCCNVLRRALLEICVDVVAVAAVAAVVAENDIAVVVG